MSMSLQRLLPLFRRELAGGESMVLATVLHTAGPTYTKPGAQMLIARSGEYAGLLSGGCLEGDLSERAARVFASGRSEVVRYDMRGPEDLLFGLGSGCEGAMDILLQRLDAAGAWQPLRRLADAWMARRTERLLLVVRSVRSTLHSVTESPTASTDDATWPAGCGIFLDDGETFGAPSPACTGALRRTARELPLERGSRLLPQALPGTDLLLLEQSAPPRVLLLGAGADAQPVAHLIVFLGWSLTVVDHRSHYARAERFTGADAVLDGGAQALPGLLRAGPPDHRFSAAIVMSHHLASDLAYLRALAASDVPYVGLLGPVSRRERLLADLGSAAAASIEPRLHAPVGLDLGANSPEAIALAIVAEIHAALAGHAIAASLSTRLARPLPLRTPA